MVGCDIYLCRKVGDTGVLCEHLVQYSLKVGGNEKNGGSGRSQMLDNGLGPWQSRFIFNLNVQFLSKISYFRFRL